MASFVLVAFSAYTTSAPKARRSASRSGVTLSGRTQRSRYPLARATIARLIPVFPLVGSRIVLSGVSSPSFSAALTMYRAMRSFTLPVGLWPSSLAYTATPGFGLRCRRRTSGVLPMVSRIDSQSMVAAGASLARAAGQRRQDREDVAFLERRVQLAQEAHIFIVQVYVHKAVDLSVHHHHVHDPRVLAVKVFQHLAHCAAFALYRPLSPDDLLERRRHFHLYCHLSSYAPFSPGAWS